MPFYLFYHCTLTWFVFKKKDSFCHGKLIYCYISFLFSSRLSHKSRILLDLSFALIMLIAKDIQQWVTNALLDIEFLHWKSSHQSRWDISVGCSLNNLVLLMNSLQNIIITHFIYHIVKYWRLFWVMYYDNHPICQWM